MISETTFILPIQFKKKQGIQLFFCDAYGSMLWDLSSKYLESFFRAWNIQTRLAWNVPRDTHVNLVENFFCQGIDPLRIQVLSRYRNFLSNLSKSPSKEVRFLFFAPAERQKISNRKNIEYLNGICQCDILKFSS